MDGILNNYDNKQKNKFDNILLVKGECLDVMNQIPDGSIDFVLTDPPYGTTQCKWDSVIDIEDMFTQLERITKQNSAIALFAAEPYASKLRMSNQKMYKFDWYWNKTQPTGFLNAKKQPLRNIENILMFYKSQPLYNPQKTTGHKRKVSTAVHKRNSKMTDDYGKYNLSSYDSTERYPTQLLTFKSDKQKCAIHPTQKPVALLEYLINTYTNPGDTVLDFTMGSGSTGVACVHTGRKFIGIELDDLYYELASNRIADEISSRNAVKSKVV